MMSMCRFLVLKSHTLLKRWPRTNLNPNNTKYSYSTCFITLTCVGLLTVKLFTQDVGRQTQSTSVSHKWVVETCSSHTAVHQPAESMKSHFLEKKVKTNG